jgi:hypothetical protein
MSLILAALVTVQLQIIVRTYDSVGVSPGEMDQARTSVDAILASTGIRPIWRPCHQPACTEPVKPHEVVVRIVTSGPQSAPDSLGFSMVDVSQHAGSLATIYEDRVHALAASAEVESGRLLGRVIAHEVGHMLLGTTSHSRVGLMRALWVTGELRRDSPADWTFSRSESAELRQRVIARTETAAVPAAIVAENETGGSGPFDRRAIVSARRPAQSSTSR